MSAPSPSPARVGLVMLAAGGSARLGQPKQLLVYAGQTLLHRTAQAAQGSECRPLVAVLGAQADRMRAEFADSDASLVENPDWERGMGSSVRCGLRALLALAPELEAAVFAVCDQPFLSSGVLDSLVRAHLVDGAAIAACAYGGTVGVPSLFARPFFPELLALPDDAGAKLLLKRHAAVVTTVPFPEGLTDIDTPDDYAHLRQSVADTLPRA